MWAEDAESGRHRGKGRWWGEEGEWKAVSNADLFWADKRRLLCAKATGFNLGAATFGINYHTHSSTAAALLCTLAITSTPIQTLYSLCAGTYCYTGVWIAVVMNLHKIEQRYIFSLQLTWREVMCVFKAATAFGWVQVVGYTATGSLLLPTREYQVSSGITSSCGRVLRWLVLYSRLFWYRLLSCWLRLEDMNCPTVPLIDPGCSFSSPADQLANWQIFPMNESASRPHIKRTVIVSA